MEAALHTRPTAVRTASAALTPVYDRPVRRRDRHAETALHLVPTTQADRQLAEIDVVPAERSELVTRAVNVVIASIGLVLAAPIMLAVGVLIRLTSPGPILYSQTRVGVDRRWRRKITDDRRVQDHGGKPFEMYKFRSMRTDAEKDGRAVWAQKQDPRVTPIGGFLRKTRLDELPQLYNVIRGDMNIVGPRPERPTIFAEMRETIPEYATRQRVKPGITGWAQINQAYDTCVDDVRSKVRYDLDYLKRQSLGMDLRIMSMTIPVMLLRRGGQ
jgi:lipopolysaccharide/colanic/teichoic acid biosynthesis glycosyltransferase